MKNSKYKQGALRVIVDQRGVQYLATPEGEKLPLIVATSVSQNMEEARKGTAQVFCEIHIQKEGFPSSESAIKIISYTQIEVGTRTLTVDNVKETATTPGEPCRAMIRTTAYLDPTV